MTRPAWLAVAVAVAVVLAGSVAAVVATGAATDTVLVVTDADDEELLVTPVDGDTEIAVEYTHSVEKTLVRDVYVAEDGRLVMTRMEFSSFGAGLPSTVDVTEVDGRYVYDPPPTAYDPLRITTGPVADHDLVVGDERYDLADLADGGTVELRVETRFRL